MMLNKTKTGYMITNVNAVDLARLQLLLISAGETELKLGQSHHWQPLGDKPARIPTGRRCPECDSTNLAGQTCLACGASLAGSDSDPHNPTHVVGFGDGGYIVTGALEDGYTVTFYGESDPQSTGLDWPTAVKVLSERIAEYHQTPGAGTVVPCWAFNMATGQEIPLTVPAPGEAITVYPGGDLQCLCDNSAAFEGFYPCDPSTGEVVSPLLGGPWNETHLVCVRCSRIIDQNTGAVTGVKEAL